jgi:glutamate synthase (NADPH/NADH) small chain
MGKVTGFIEFGRENTPHRPVEERLRDWHEVQLDPSPEQVRKQAARCMDCGIPLCNNGCPLGNIIPDWNDFAYRDKWQEALSRLHSTNNFPEFTGLVCPAPCEAACVLGINQDPVTIKQVEWEIIRRGWEEGFVVPLRPQRRSGRSVAVVGSGPAGLAAAQQLSRAGHSVTVFEKSDRIGGLLRYGIPDFKLEKWLIDRRLDQMREEGAVFQTGVQVGADLSTAELRRHFDAVLLCLGCEQSRDLPVPGRELAGVHFAMEFLAQNNNRVAGDAIADEEAILATGKHVVVLGGGDTGSDCVGTSHRQGAKSVTSIEVLERPPERRDASTPWPLWPLMFRTSSSHEEGGTRDFAVLTKRLLGENGRVTRLHAVRLRHLPPDPKTGRRDFEEIAGSDFEIPADLVLLAMGFVHPVQTGLLQDLDVKLDARGNVAADTRSFATSEPGVFAAGDCRRGQSLVVWALFEGREAARAVDSYLTGHSRLQSRDGYV